MLILILNYNKSVNKINMSTDYKLHFKLCKFVCFNKELT